MSWKRRLEKVLILAMVLLIAVSVINASFKGERYLKTSSYGNQLDKVATNFFLLFEDYNRDEEGYIIGRKEVSDARINKVLSDRDRIIYLIDEELTRKKKLHYVITNRWSKEGVEIEAPMPTVLIFN